MIAKPGIQTEWVLGRGHKPGLHFGLQPQFSDFDLSFPHNENPFLVFGESIVDRRDWRGLHMEKNYYGLLFKTLLLMCSRSPVCWLVIKSINKHLFIYFPRLWM